MEVGGELGGGGTRNKIESSRPLHLFQPAVCVPPVTSATGASFLLLFRE